MPYRFFILMLLLGSSAAFQLRSDERQGSVADGVYTAEQAQRGAETYQEHCQSCHATDMRGGPAARGLTGLEFQYLWKEKNLAELFSALREKMPPADPGTLGDQVYVDLIATILQRNGFPEGTAELEADLDTLRTITIRWQ